ncbi:helix-turn-helix transcriptional regulator [Nodosilinea sp. LEGE 06152]|uniref:helix-turn-helix domain-containing protein n=1 Tax=Nodosilinea sp. LEGE 06152 TaxID=2777966 RepID=UPI00187E2F78|nr:helix-turn-helix transcriptional regulator [Nodosilinea sp. LEGE 06152]MBE9156683.1 helix-turn-helix transcriptional regulator [Nodosilinea sp. LEGE 06152]
MSSDLTPSFSSRSLPRQQPEIGQLIRDLRQAVGSTQEQFAVALGVSFSTLNRWENGHMQPSPLALRQVESVIADLSQSAKLPGGSEALLAKYGCLGS